MGIINKIKIFFLLIPVFIFTQESNDIFLKTFVIDTLFHNVEKKQTLYSISKIYNVSVEDIKRYNSKIKGSRLSRKMILKIPIKKQVEPEIKFLEKSNDTLDFSVSNLNNIVLNLLDSVVKKKIVKVALLAPFKLDQIELDSVDNSKKFLKNLNLTTISLDFYSGVIMALDKAKERGVNIELNVLDTKNNLDTISNLLKENKLDEFDFVLGPFIPRNINLVSKKNQDFKTTIVSPLSSKEIEINKNVVQSMPSKVNQRKIMLNYIDSLIEIDSDPCVMIIYDNESLDIKKKLNEKFPYAELINTDENNGFVDPEITDSLLVSTKNNYVFLESENLNTIASVSSLLNSQISDERNIAMMTTFRSDIYENENISFEHLGNLNFTYPSYYFPQYENEEIGVFNNKYLEEFGKRPNKIAIRAHDITLDMVFRIAIKRKFKKSIEIGETGYLQNKFNYSNYNQGFINESVYLIKHEKLNIKEIKIKN